MIHVCFGIHDEDGRYSKFTGTAILSMFENCFANKSITVHLLHDNTLTEDNRDKFSYIAGRYGQFIEFHNVEKICANQIESLKKTFANYPTINFFTIGAFFRLLTPIIFPEFEKIIYLDSDIIVNLDIAELWQIPIGDKPIAAISEVDIGTIPEQILLLCIDGIVDKDDYFNSGVLLMNLKQLRTNEKENLDNGINFLAENPKYNLFDQEILNYSFSKNYLKLPNKFNFFARYSRQLKETKIERRIYHYSANDLGTNFDDILFKLWFSYFEKTPWFNKDIIAHIDEELKKFYSDSKNFALQLSALMSGKLRAFVLIDQDVDFVKKNFAVKDDEEIISLTTDDSISVLLDYITESRGKKVIFILFSAYYQMLPHLINAGFVEGQDFINAALFLSDANGIPLNTYQFVKAM